jgi:hypothetical protein
MKQRIRSKMGRRISLAVTALIAAGALGTSGVAGAAITGTVTSVSGETSVGERPAEISDVVSEGESIVTGPEAACSVLVDKRALIQFCGKAAVRLRRDEDRNATVVDVLEGSTRTLAGPRSADEPLEIHTPVAIAAILGTILSVTVDPATNDSTFALEEGSAKIDTRDGRTVMLQAGQQITIHGDGRVSAVEPIRARDIAKEGDCLDDRYFHGVSIEIARDERLQWLTDAITAADIPYAGLPPVAAPPRPPFEPPLDPPGGPEFDPCGLAGCNPDNFPQPDPVRPPERVREEPTRGGGGRQWGDGCTGSHPGEPCN